MLGTVQVAYEITRTIACLRNGTSNSLYLVLIRQLPEQVRHLWWRGDQRGIKTHMGYNQEAFDAECAALARALESASRRNVILNRIPIFTDAQAAIRRMASDEPGPGQMYALEARKNITALRRAVPDIVVEITWCPAHEGVEGNGKADEWAKVAAEEPDARGVEGLEWFTY